MSYKNRGNFGVYINLERNRSSIEIGSSDISLSKIRKVKVDGKYISPLKLTEYLGIISLTPLMDKIFIEGATNRRKFFDKISWVFISAHANNVRSYEKAIKERNNLLKVNSSDKIWFDNIEKHIVKYGTQIIINRLKVLKLLNEQISNNIINFPKANMNLVGEIENIFNQNPDINTFSEMYLKSLNEKRKIDFYRGFTSIGPHKTDLEVIYRKRNDYCLCSTGEQKSLLISIILSVTKSYKKHTIYLYFTFRWGFSHLDNDKK